MLENNIFKDGIKNDALVDEEDQIAPDTKKGFYYCSYLSILDYEIEESLKETDKSWQIKIKNGPKTWFPKSKCTIENGNIRIPQWLAMKKRMRINKV